MALLIDDGGIRYAPPPVQRDGTKTDTVRSTDTVQTVAQRNGVSPESLAAANNIPTDAALTPGRVLDIPVTEPQEPDTDQSGTTPQQRVDQALARYKEAVKSGDKAAIEKAKQDLNAAVRGEVGPQVNVANAHIPAQYRPSPDEQITSYGNIILRRYQGDAQAQAALGEAINDYKIQRKADMMAPQLSGDKTMEQKMAELKLAVAGQPPEVVARIMQNPAVQQLLKDAASWVKEPFNGINDADPFAAGQAALDASKRLAELTALLSPEQARALVQECLPIIKKIAAIDANAIGPEPFETVSRAVEAMGDSPEAQALTREIAQSYRDQVLRWGVAFEDSVKTAVANGAHPRLALEITKQLQAEGKTTEAAHLLQAVKRGVEDLKKQIEADYKDYAEHTKDLHWLISNSRGKMTEEQLKKAIDDYTNNKQGGDWQKKLKQLEGELFADTKAYNEAVAAMEGLPQEVKQTAPDVFTALKEMGSSKVVQQASLWTLSKDPSVFDGVDGDSLMSYWAGVAHSGRDFIDSVTQAWVAGKVMPVLANTDFNDPASVEKLKKVMADFEAKAVKYMGIPDYEATAIFSKFRNIIDSVQPGAVGNVDVQRAQAAALQKELEGLNEMRFGDSTAGRIFRTVGLGLSLVAAYFQAGSVASDPTNLQNLPGTLAVAVGLAKDAAAFGAVTGVLDTYRGVGGWGMGTTAAGVKTASAIAWLNMAYFGIGVVDNLTGKDRDKTLAGLNAVAGAGAAVALWGSGAWAGPVGWGITFLAVAGMEVWKVGKETRENTGAAEDFFKAGGVDAATAKTLSTQALGPANRLQKDLGLSPQQIQDLAAKHPELFKSGADPAEAFVDTAKACGIKGEDVIGFADALAKDNRKYLDALSAQGKDIRNPWSYQANLFSKVMDRSPTAAEFVRQHAPEKVGPDADARRQAARDYENSNQQAQTISQLLVGGKSDAYKAEIIRIMKESNALDRYMDKLITIEGASQAAREAIQAAEKGGVLSPEEAQKYLAKVP